MTRHATYRVVEDELSQKGIARVKYVGEDGRVYGTFLPASHDILDDQEALDAYMRSVEARVLRDEQRKNTCPTS